MDILLDGVWYSIEKDDIDIIRKGKRHFYEYDNKKINKNAITRYTCSKCGKIVERKFFYTKNFDLRCEKCKIKETKKKKYGNENAFNFGSKEFNKVLFGKYKVLNISQTKKQKENLKNNKNIPLYGSFNYKKLMLEKYGV